MRSLFITTVLLALAAGTYALAGETKLPEPKKSGGVSVLEAIDRRGSFGSNEAPNGKLSQEDLAAILWAATGLNRDGKKWTVPMASGRAPYSKIYVLDDDGAFLYDWKDNSLIEVNKQNVKPDIANQAYAKTMPTILIVATDGTELAKMDNVPLREEYAVLLAGAMSQDVYLASEAVGVGAHLVYSIDRGKATAALGLTQGERALFAILLGKK